MPVTCRFVLALLATSLLACDKRPINPTAALPSLGTPLPAFAFPAHRGPDSVRSVALRNTPTVLALWSTHCPYQGPWVAALDSLAREFVPRGARVVVLADDAPGRVLDSVLMQASWPGVVTAIGVADGALVRLFDRAREAPERATERVEFVLPSFLLIGPDGRVVRRAWGSTASFRPALDSLLRSARDRPLSPAVQHGVAPDGAAHASSAGPVPCRSVCK